MTETANLQITHVVQGQAQYVPTINGAFDILDAAAGGSEDVDVSVGGTIVLTNTALRGGYVRFTGTPPGAVVVRIPDGIVRGPRVLHNTTGQTVTLQHVSTAGVAVLAGTRVLAVADGTDWLTVP